MFGWFIGRNKGFQPNTIPDMQLWLPADRIGVQGYSLDFDGTDDYVQANNVITAYPFTLECWVRFDVVNVNQSALYLSKSTTTNVYYGFGLGSTGKLLIQTRNTTDTVTNGNTTISANTWIHLACVFTSDTSRTLYLNGVSEITQTNNIAFASTDIQFLMGLFRTNSPSNYLNGKLSDVRIWNTARTAQQIADNYQKRLIGNESGLVGYWKLDKGSGTSVADSTTNANAGTISGAIWDNNEPFTEPIDDGTAVRVWADQSGKGYDATQSATAARPTYIANGLNGLPVVRFDGTDDRLTIPSSTATFKFLHSDVSTIFIVAKAGIVADPNASYSFLGNQGVNSANVGYMLTYDDRSVFSRNNMITPEVTRGVSGSYVSYVFFNNAFTSNTFGMVSVISDPANATAGERLAVSANGGTANKTNTQTGAISTANASFNLDIGAGGNNNSRLTGDIAEIIVYNRALNTSELAQVHRYLSRKWGIQLA